jgi:hypothetical protein
MLHLIHNGLGVKGLGCLLKWIAVLLNKICGTQLTQLIRLKYYTEPKQANRSIKNEVRTELKKDITLNPLKLEFFLLKWSPIQLWLKSDVSSIEKPQKSSL